MIDVVGVVFSDSNKIYYFLQNDIVLKKDDKVIVNTERGEQFGIVATDIISVDSKKISFPLKNIIRKAGTYDEKMNIKNQKDAISAIKDAQKFCEELNLDMHILSASFTLDRKQLLFNFVSDDRVDFRELAKKLAAIYRTRIELRQIGVRDKAKEVGGIGQCGRALCCSTFLKDLNSVSINMAKNQNLALNPQKINGVCGRLMCCLDFENDLYADYKKGLPKMNQVIETEYGKGKVVYIDIFNRMYKVEIDGAKIVEIYVK